MEGVTSTANTDRMATTDDGLDATSRRLLNEIDELKRLELEKRHTARSSDEFHDLAAKSTMPPATSSTPLARN